MSKYSNLQVKNTISNIAYVFFGFGAIVLLFVMDSHTQREKVFLIFSTINMIFYWLIGLGLLLKYKWAFEGFRLFHTLGYYCYPVGTYWAIYMQEKLDADGLSHYFDCDIKELKKRKAPFSRE